MTNALRTKRERMQWIQRGDEFQTLVTLLERGVSKLTVA